MKPRSNENKIAPEPQSPSRGSEEGASSPQTETQKPSAGGSPRDGELSKYDALSKELAGSVRALSLLHEQRASFQARADALKAERADLEQKVLDGNHEAIAELVLNNDAVTLNEVKLSALSVRTERLETELHSRFPLALLCFERLRGRLVTCIADTAKESVTKLLAPDHNVAEEHLNAIVIETPSWIEISRLKLPGLTHINSRPLDEDQPHWSSLVRPFTPAEKAALRAETVKATIDATNALLRAAGRLIELMQGYPERVPTFKCEAEVIEPAVVDPKFLEWQQPLGGSDEQFAREVCQAAGKPYPPQSEADQRILSEMIQARHQMPIAYGSVSGEMIGSTQPV